MLLSLERLECRIVLHHASLCVRPFAQEWVWGWGGGRYSTAQFLANRTNGRSRPYYGRNYATVSRPSVCPLWRRLCIVAKQYVLEHW